MTKFGKTLAILATVGGIAAAGMAVAQPHGPGGPGPMGPGYGGYGGYGMMGGWGGGYANPEARLDALKTALGIKPEQQAAWDGYVKALQDSAAQMQAIRTAMWKSMGAADWQQHQALMAQAFNQRAQAFKTVQGAGAKLMAVLDDQQKTTLASPELTGNCPGLGSGGGPGMGYGGRGMGWGGGPGMMGYGGGPGWMGGGMMGSGPGGSAR
jgi:hypothetical protein